MVAAGVHSRSTHIDAPVAVVFAHVRDPLSFMAADPEPVRIDHVRVTQGPRSRGESGAVIDTGARAVILDEGRRSVT